MTRQRKKKQRVSNNNKNVSTNTQFVKLKPRSANQRELLKSIYSNTITFCLGPAGTGKTCVSVGAAVFLLMTKKIKKIIITRPIIESGQAQNKGRSNIGYLPGDLDAKMAPYLRPLHDELAKFLNKSQIQELRNESQLEICPLEFMRGRTFEDSFIICDEAQNANEEHIEMLVTRLGNGSKMVISGDVEQSDLLDHQQGGLENFIDDLDGIPGIGIIELDISDVNRHPLVAQIIKRRREVKESLKELKEPIKNDFTKGYTEQEGFSSER